MSSGFGEVGRLRLKQAFDTNGSEQQWWKDTGGLSISLSSDMNVDQVIDQMAGVETTVHNVLKRKRNNPNQAITLSDTETQVLNAWRDCVDGAKPYLDSLSQANAAIRKHQSGIASSNTEQISKELDRFKAILTGISNWVIIPYVDICAKNIQICRKNCGNDQPKFGICKRRGRKIHRKNLHLRSFC